MPRPPTAPLSRSALGKRSRTKGKVFELVVRDLITTAFKDVLPNLSVHRTSQADRAWESDIIIDPGDHVPDWLHDLWVECEHANEPDPLAKLQQAVRDAEAATKRTRRLRVPVVAWRRTGARTVNLTTNLAWLVELVGGPEASLVSPTFGLVVTLPITEALNAMARRIQPL